METMKQDSAKTNKDKAIFIKRQIGMLQSDFFVMGYKTNKFECNLNIGLIEALEM